MTKVNLMRWVLVAISILLIAGCASTRGPAAPPPPSDEEVVAGIVNSAMEALMAKDVAALVALYSDDFSSDQGDKEDMTAFLQGASEQGFLDGMEIDQTNATIEVDGDTATAKGIALSGAFGAITLSFDFEKRDGKWWVTSQTQEQ